MALTYPAKNALNGKFVTSTQYTNCRIPETMRKTRNASMSLSRGEVVSLYAFHRDCTADEAAAGDASGGAETVVLVEDAADFDGAMTGVAPPWERSTCKRGVSQTGKARPCWHRKRKRPKFRQRCSGRPPFPRPAPRARASPRPVSAHDAENRAPACGRLCASRQAVCALLFAGPSGARAAQPS